MNKFLEKLAKMFLCPLDIHIKIEHFGYNTWEFEYCELCHKERYFKKWEYNPN